MKKIAVILSGCGYLDGAEIREAVISLLAIERNNAQYDAFAPDINQMHVVNHLNGKEESGQSRNVLVESARIMRGKVSDIKNLDVDKYDALVLPGGFGVAKNLSDLAIKGSEAQVNEDFKRITNEFIKQQKPIGAICISPAVLVAALKDQTSANVTIGDDGDNLIQALGGNHIKCATDEIAIDEKNKIISCSAYMRDDTIKNVASGIEKLIAKVIEIC